MAADRCGKIGDGREINKGALPGGCPGAQRRLDLLDRLLGFDCANNNDYQAVRAKVLVV